jgi:S-DNA-T family DNA segregation ATPase FtsK/SpoIIIE
MSLSRLINKTPLTNEKYNIYELDQIDGNVISKIINSRFIGEGVYSIEQFSMPDYTEKYLVSPSFDKFSYQPIEKKWNFTDEDMNTITTFELVLEKPSFMPLDNKQFIDLFNVISNFPDAVVFSQVLICKRLDNWRENAITSYEAFLKGNDNPLESKFSIKLQTKVLNVLNKIGNYNVERERIEEMEQKILQNNYRFECRFIVFDPENVDIFVSEMEKTLQKLQLFNDLLLKKVQNKRNFVKYFENREFKSELVNQMLSEHEVYSVLVAEYNSTTNKMELEKPIKHQSTIRNIEDSLLLQKAIQIMPYSEKKNAEIDRSKIEQLNQAFKRVGSIKKSMKAVEMYQGSSLLKIQFAIPQDINYSHISKKLVDIQAAMGNQNITIEIGDKPNTINTFIPLQKREVLYFRNILESSEFQEFKKNNQLPFIIGESVNGEYLFACLTKLRHILVAGATGGGKSIFVNLIILGLLLNVPPDELVMHLIDPKMVEYTQFSGFPQVREVITDMKKANTVLSSLCIEMDKRYEIFSKSSVRDIQGYHELGKKMPYIICVIDEFADLMMINKDVEDYVVRLGQKARGAGLHLILATQRPSVDVITGLIKANMPSRFTFSVTSQVDSKTILDKGGAEKLLGKGDGLAKIEGNVKEFERFQSPVLTLDSKQETKIYQELKELFKDVQVIEDELPEVESDMDKLKRIIANTGELRVSSLQEKMGIAIGKVTELLKQLVEDEWLRKEGRAYVINIDEDEIVKWKNIGEL